MKLPNVITLTAKKIRTDRVMPSKDLLKLEKK